MKAVQTALQQLLQQAAPNQWRGLVVLQDATGKPQAQLLVNGSQSKAARPDVLCMGGQFLVPLNAYRAYLGRAYSAVVLDFRQQQHADALAAMAGTVVGGGLLVLLTSTELSPFMRHLLAQQPNSLYYRTVVRSTSPLVASPFNISDLPLPVASRSAITEATLSSEQHAVASALLTHHQQAPDQPALLTAPRGRGKSTVLGFVAQKLRQQGANIYICAPSKAQAHVVLRQAYWQAPGGEQKVHFLPPDALLGQQAAAVHGTVILDEAASLPRHMLDTLLRRYPGVIMATTTQGYECCGRGFLLQFQQRLRAEFSRALQLTLTTPFRFAPNCPLEQWLEQRLLLASGDEAKAGQPNAVQSEASESKHTEYEYYHSRARELTEHQLQQCFNLLMEAHYQTRPNDLKLLLDDPTQSLMLQYEGGHVVGVAWLAKEGDLPLPLAEDVVAGRRRPPGNLLAQGLARHLRDPSLAGFHMLRVVRIAVQPNLQRQKRGSQLLAKVQDFAEHSQVQLIGTSFGASSELVHFWSKNGFAPVKLGAKPDTVTARLASLWVQPLAPNLVEQSLIWRHYFVRDLAGYNGSKGIDLALHEALKQAAQNPQGQTPLATIAAPHMPQEQAYLEFVRRRLLDVANGELEFHAVQATLRANPQWSADEPLLACALAEELLPDAILQKYGLRGRKDLIKALREVCFRLSVKI